MHAGAVKVGDVRIFTKFHAPVSWLVGYSSVNWDIGSVLAECITEVLGHWARWLARRAAGNKG